jgi:hypothetical protein
MTRAALLIAFAVFALVGVFGTIALLRARPADIPAVLNSLAGLARALRA